MAVRASTNPSYAGRSTKIRLRAQQSWPVFANTAHIERSTQVSMSASANTTFADLPPSSSETRVMLRAASAMIADPISVEPVNPTLETRGSVTSALPTLDPGPGRTDIVPSGSPASARISASRSSESGVSDAGLTTIVFPHARAGAIFHVAITSGKFQGVISAHTPTGSRSVTSSPGSWTGTVSPKILFAAPPQYSSVFATIPISSRASPIGLPTFRASICASSSSRSRTRTEALSNTRPRSVAEVLGHGPSSNARTATSTARRASSGPASATSAIGEPFPGSMTVKVPSSAAGTRSPPTISSSVVIVPP